MAAATQVQSETVATPVTKSPLDIAVDKVVQEIMADPEVQDCTPEEATHMIDVWLPKMLARSRKSSIGITFPYAQEMQTRDYEIFDAVIPHDQIAAPGSAHEAVQMVVLDAAAGELTLTHGQRNEYGQMAKPGQPVHCTVRIGMGVFS